MKVWPSLVLLLLSCRPLQLVGTMSYSERIDAGNGEDGVTGTLSGRAAMWR